MSTYEFKRISRFIQDNYGIKLPEQKLMMVQGRLHKRLMALNMSNFKEYVGYLFSVEGQEKEIPQMVDLISTNKTDFFREAAHFNVLSELVLPEYVNTHSFSTFKIWSAGCSSGEEVYTLAMVISEFFESHKGYNYKILGSDISYKMLKTAKAAIYDFKDVATMPLYLKKKYLLKHKNREIKKVRISPDLRSRADFIHLNFMDENYELDIKYDVAFCRNVLIYFERDVQLKVIQRILEYVKPGGYLFLGHSESINDMDLPLKKISPTVFQKIKK
ncbi:MAG: methyltransferase domain-containing protein [Bacteroidales bacterium]|nr:methyltransferase domain-containing protein [Bacteroidales bacterium]